MPPVFAFCLSRGVCCAHSDARRGFCSPAHGVEPGCAVHAPLAFSSPTSVSACVRVCVHHLNCGYCVFSRFLAGCWRLRFPNFRERLHRVEDFWQGYKLFSYTYYSHSVRHESEFRDSKLGTWLPCIPVHNPSLFVLLSLLLSGIQTLPRLCA